MSIPSDDYNCKCVIFNLIVARGRNFGVGKLRFSQHFNVSKIIEDEILQLIDTTIQKELDRENISLKEREAGK